MCKLSQPTPEQLALIFKFDELNKSILMCWGRKNINVSKEIGDWTGPATQLRQSVISTSNRVVFAAILRPGQVEKLKSAIWSAQGPACLLDTELAARLGINKEQRAMIQNALDQSEQAHKDFLAKAMPFYNRSDDPLVKRQFADLTKENRNEINQAVWDLLTPSQTSKLGGLLGERPSKAKPPQQKNTSPRPAPAS